MSGEGEATQAGWLRQTSNFTLLRRCQACESEPLKQLPTNLFKLRVVGVPRLGVVVAAKLWDEGLHARRGRECNPVAQGAGRPNGRAHWRAACGCWERLALLVAHTVCKEASSAAQ